MSIVLQPSNSLIFNMDFYTFGAEKSSIGKSSGKWYWEVNRTSVNLYIGQTKYGVGSKETPTGTGANDIFSTHSDSQVFETVVTNDASVYGIALDFISKEMSLYRNGVFQSKVSVNTDFELYPMVFKTNRVNSGNNRVIGVVNFGDSQFDIETSNPTEWENLKRQGFKPYSFMPTIKHLIKSSNKVQTLSRGLWTDIGVTTPTVLDFETYGMVDLSSIPQEKWSELTKPIEVYTWTDNVEATTSSISYKYNHFNSPELELAVPEYRLVDQLERPISILTYTDGEEIPKLKQEHDYNKVGSRILKRG